MKKNSPDWSAYGKPAVAKRRTRMLALEPRILFDGVALVDPMSAMGEAPQPTSAPLETSQTAVEAGAAPVVRPPSDDDAGSKPVSQTDASASDTPHNALASNSGTELPTSQEEFLASAPRSSREIVFYDAKLEGLAQLLAELGPHVELVVLDSARDGVQQINEATRAGEPVAAIHILTHGNAGALALGTSTLDLASLETRAADLTGWNLSSGGDILIYGCDVAAGESGQQFVARLAQLTGADVAASVDLTGASALGGNWVLEFGTGAIETPVFALNSYTGLLAAPTGTARSNAVNESASLNFAGETFGFADADSHTLASITITTLPSAADGELRLNGVPVALNAVVPAPQFPNLVFVPVNKTAGYAATFQFRVTDSNGETSASTYTYTINVSAANDAPLAVADTGSIAEDAVSVAGNVLSNDVDDANDTRNVSAIAGGTVGQALNSSYGSLTLAANGSYTYTLNNALPAVQALAVGQTLTEVFTYTMVDGAGQTSTSTLTITISGTNDAPVASAVNLSVITPVPENATDAENPGTLVGALLSTSNGTVLVTDVDASGVAPGIAVYGSSTTGGMTGVWQYQLNGSGTWVAFTPAVSAATLLPADARIRFVADNDAADDAKESGAATIQYYAWDRSQGTVGGTLNVADGQRGGTNAISLAGLTATINIAPRNDAPVLSVGTISVSETNNSFILTANSNPADPVNPGTHLYLYDPDNTTDQLMYRLEVLPGQGKLYKNGVELGVGSLFTHDDVVSGRIRYTYTGSELSADTADSFRVSLRDGAGGVIGATGATGANAWATVAITITDVNAQVSAGTVSFTTTEYVHPGDRLDLTGLVPTDADAAGSPTGYPRMALQSLPAHGTIQYWNGSAYVSMTSAQLQGGASPHWFTAAQLATHPLRYIASDAEPASYGSQVTFSVHVDDGGRAGNAAVATTATTTVTINVNPVNDLPVPVTSPISVERDSSNNVIGISALTATDPDSAVSKRVYTVRGAPAQGYLVLNGVRISVGATFTQDDLDNNRLAYTHEGAAPDNDPLTYEDHFTFDVNDGDGGIAQGRLDINVLPKDIPPGPGGGTLRGTVAEGLFKTIDNTVLNGSATYTLDTAPLRGTLYLNGNALSAGASFTQADIDANRLVYLHNGVEPGTHGYTDTVAIMRFGDVAATNIVLTVTPVDDAPVLTQTDPSTITLDEQSTGTPFSGSSFDLTGVTHAYRLTTAQLSGTDIDTANAQLYYVLETAPTNGTVMRWNGNAWVGLTAGATFNVADIASGLIAYVHDPVSEIRADSLSVYLIDGATVQAGNVVVTPGSGISEAATLTVTDGVTSIALAKGAQMRSLSRTVNFAITNVNDAPVASGVRFAVDEGTGETASTRPTNPGSIRVLTTAILVVTDSDDTVSGFNNGVGQGYYELISLPPNGWIQFYNGTQWVDMSAGDRFSYSDLAAGNLRYAHAGSETTSDSFQFRAVDPQGAMGNTATVNVDVRPLNDPPLVQGLLELGGSSIVPEGGARKITSTMLGVDLATTDPDNTANQVQYRLTAVNNLRGTLYLGDPVTGVQAKALGVGSAITLQQILDGRLWYQHDGSDPDGYARVANFSFQVSDSSGMNEPTGTFTINLVPVNDAPALTGLSGGAVFTEGDTSTTPNVAPIFIDSSVVLADNDLANNNADFRGGYLRLHYQSGGSVHDQLAVANIGAGVGQIGTSGSNVTWGGVVIGTIDAIENGANGNALRIDFSGGANTALTVAAIDALIEALTFAHTEYDNAVAGTRTLAYTLVDGGGTDAYTDDRGRTFSGADTWTGTATVSVVAANDRPILTPHTGGGNLVLGTISEDVSNPSGYQISSFISAVNGAASGTQTGIADVDTGATHGIAVTGLTNAGGGKWQYSTNGTTWTDVGSVSETSALLLTASDYLRFLPDQAEGGTATFTYKAWDQTSGSAYAKVNTTSTSQTSAYSAATDVAQVSITPVNDAPTLGGPTVVTAIEDTLFSFTGANLQTLADVDAGSNLIMLTLAFTGSGTFQFSSATAGVFSDAAGTTAHSTWNGYTDGSSLALYGTTANLNAALAKLQYNPAAHANNTNLASQAVTTQPKVALTVDDRGYGVTGNNTGDTGLTATKEVTINITPANDSPTLTLSATTFGLNENAGATVITVDITVADPNDVNNTGYGSPLPSLQLTAARGTLSFAGATGVTVTGNNSKSLTLTGSLADINAAISGGNHALSYNPDVDFSGTDTIALTLNDNGNVGGGNLTATGSISVTISGVNNAPAFAALDATPVFTENGGVITLDGNATLSDAELTAYNNWNHAVLTITRSGGANADDVFGVTGSGSTGVNFSGSNIRVGTTTVGTYTNSNGTLNITFNASATNARVNQVLQAITYRNTNDNPPGSVTLAYTINDSDTDPDRAGQGQGTGGALTGSGQVVVSIVAANDNPTLTGLATVGYTEDAAAIVLAPAAVPGDPELGHFAGQGGDWGGARLTISRNGGASSEDVFGHSGTLGALVAGQDLVLNGSVIGTVTTNGGGTLALTFADNTTTAQVQSVMRQITYANSRQSLAAGGSASVTLNWVLEDGDSDVTPRSNDQGLGGNLSVTVAQTVNLTGVNDAPVLSTAPNLAITQAEDAAVPAGAVGVLVSTLTTGVSDVDASAVNGIAITAADSSLGTWYYSTNDGTTWSTLPTVADNDALLLRSTDRLYFRPNADVNGVVSEALTIRAWDRTTGTQGTKVDTTTNGGSTAYSTATDTVQLTVTPVNDAPTRTAASVSITVNEDTSSPAGTTVSALFGPVFSDATDNQSAFTSGSSANSLAGIAIVGNAAIATQGTWQYYNGTSWANVSTSVSTTSALLVREDHALRFVPDANFHGTPGALTVRLIDTSGASFTSGTTVNISAGGATGGTTRYSNAANAVSVQVTVDAVNDAPSLSGTATLPSISEDTTSAGRNAAQIAAGLSYNDSTDNRTAITGGGNTASAHTAIAIVGNAATASQGTWQYTLDGSTWHDVATTIGNGSAIVLDLADGNHQIRFVPAADFHGTPGALAVRGADSTWNGSTGQVDISANVGGSGAWSSGTASVGISVLAVNDPPSITGLNATPTFVEGVDTAGDRNVLGTPVLLDDSVQIVDVELVTTGEDTFAGATLTIARNDGTSGFAAHAQDVFGLATTNLSVAGSVISIGGTAIADITSNSGGQLVITFRAAASSAHVNTVASSITYANSSDTPPANVNIRYRFNDDNQGAAQGSGGSLTGDATITVQITASNDPPLAVNDTNAITEDTATVTGNVIAGGAGGAGADSDPENDTLSVTAVRTGTEAAGTGTAGTVGAAMAGSYGSLTLNADGSYSYALDNDNATVNQLKNGDTLTDVFTYTISDGNGGTDIAQLTITINGNTDAAPSIGATDHNGAATGQNTVLEAGLTSAGDSSESTTGNVTVSADDGLASVSIGGTSVSLAALQALGTTPVVIDTGEGTLTLTGFTATTTVGGVPTAGTIAYSYTLKARLDHSGASESSDVIALAITDAGGGTGSGTFTVRIVDDTPAAANDSNSIVEDAALNTVSGSVLGNDRIGADTNANPVTGVSFGGTARTVGTGFSTTYGSLVLNADGSYTYTLDNSNAAVNALSAASAPLTETITYTITDGDGDTATATLTISITGANDAPVLVDTVRNVTQVEDAAAPLGAVGVTVADLLGTGGSSDADADALALGIALTGTDTTRGSWMVSLDGGTTWTDADTVSATGALLLGPDARLYFLPAADRNTSDGSTGANEPISAGLTFRAWDRSTGTAGQLVDVSVNGGATPYSAFADTVRLVVNPVNDAPLIVGLDASSVNAGVANPYVPGTAGVVIDPNVTFQDRELDVERNNWNGATLNIARKDGASAHDVFGAAAGGPLSLAGGNVVVSGTTIGSYTQSGGALTLSFNANATTALVNLAAQNITYANALTVPGYSSVTLTWTLNDQNPDTGGSGVAGSGQGQGSGGALQAVAEIVLALNQPPTAVPDTAVAVEAGGLNNGTPGTNATGNVLDNDTDPDPVDTKTVTTPGTYVGQYGTLTLNADGSYSYVIDNSNPTVQALRTAADTLFDSFTYTMRDAAGLTSSSTLTLTLQGANDTPVAVNDTAVAVEAGGLGNAVPGVNPSGNVLNNDTDVDNGDGKTVTTTGVFTGLYGSLTLNADGSYTYVVDNSNPTVQALRTAVETLTDSFAYTMRDTAGALSNAMLTVTLQGANDTPVAVNDVATAVEAGGIDNQTPGTNPTGNVLTNDTDMDNGDTRTVTTTGTFVGLYGTLTLNADGSYTYVVDNANLTVDRLRPGESLSEVFAYTMRDTLGATSSATLTITIQGADDALLTPPLPAPPQPTPTPPAPPPVVPPSPPSGSTGSSTVGQSFFNAAQDARIEDGNPRLTLRTAIEAAQNANNQNNGNESRKLESTDRGFPVERLKAEANAGTQVENQQKGGDRLFVFKGINNSFAQVGRSVDYRVPREAFGHTDPNAIVQLEAGLSDGNPLPEWLDFDPTSGAFSGRPPSDVEALVEVKVTARDNDGREASTTFRLQIERGAQQRGEGNPDGQPLAKAKVGKDLAKDGSKRGAVPFAEQVKRARAGDGLLDRVMAMLDQPAKPAKPATESTEKISA